MKKETLYQCPMCKRIYSETELLQNKILPKNKKAICINAYAKNKDEIWLSIFGEI